MLLVIHITSDTLLLLPVIHYIIITSDTLLLVVLVLYYVISDT